VRAAAAALIAEGDGPGAAIPILAAARDAASGAERVELECALAFACERAGRSVELLAAAARLLEARPESPAAFRLLATALRRLGRTEDLRRAAEARAGRFPRDAEALRALAALRVAQGDLPGATAILEKVAGSGHAETPDRARIAWLSLFSAPPAGRALEEIREAVAAGKREPAVLRVLAALLADADRPAEAREVLEEAVDARGGGEGDFLPEERFVVGRMAEAYGDADAAAAAYRRIAKPERADEVPASAWALAQERLEALEKGGAGEGRNPAAPAPDHRP
jgi:tetratricopeptide (TPR) repeat protein